MKNAFSVSIAEVTPEALTFWNVRGLDGLWMPGDLPVVASKS